MVETMIRKDGLLILPVSFKELLERLKTMRDMQRMAVKSRKKAYQDSIDEFMNKKYYAEEHVKGGRG